MREIEYSARFPPEYTRRRFGVYISPCEANSGNPKRTPDTRMTPDTHVVWGGFLRFNFRYVDRSIFVNGYGAKSLSSVENATRNVIGPAFVNGYGILLSFARMGTVRLKLRML